MARLICWIAVLFGSLLINGVGAHAQTRGGFSAWLQDVAQQAVSEGVHPAVVRAALRQIVLDDRVLALDEKQPERTITFNRYVSSTLPASRIKAARLMKTRNIDMLEEVADRYGVPPSMIVALWGIESSFGRDTGHFDVLSSLATLGYDGRRAAFFRQELLAALHLLDVEHLPVDYLRGSWAGAMGQCQFMPSTFLKHAVDFDGDGHRNIWDDKGDVFASIAAYLASEGWQKGQTWGREVRLTKPVLLSLIGLDKKTKMLPQWQALGIRYKNGASLPAREIQASLIQPDGPHGRSFLVYDNFRALMRWNRSTYFATTVGLFADQL